MLYKQYMQSKEWYRKHNYWLLKSNYRCSMFFWIQCGRGKSYRMHHKTYKNVGKEELWKDVIVLCPFAHDFIIHGILAGFKSAGKQKGKYPNRLQRIAHAWCCLPLIMKLVTIAATSFAICLGGSACAIAYFAASNFV